MFENKVYNGIYATRFIASWVRSGGSLASHDDLIEFSNWLVSLGLSMDDARYIKDLASNGKMELEYSARLFLKK